MSLDGGRTWRAAQLGRDKSQFGWRQWEFAWTPQREEYYNIMARANDASGKFPALGAGMESVRIRMERRAERRRERKLKSPRTGHRHAPVLSQTDQPAGLQGACLACHDEDMIRQQRLTRAQWDRELTKMTGLGAQVKPETAKTFSLIC